MVDLPHGTRATRLHSSRLGETCPYSPDAVGGVLFARNGSLLFTDVNAQEAAPKSGLCCHHPKWNTKIITEKKTIKYAITQPKRFHSRFDLGHHAQNAYPASRAFGTMINIWSQVGHAG